MYPPPTKNATTTTDRTSSNITAANPKITPLIILRDPSLLSLQPVSTKEEVRSAKPTIPMGRRYYSSKRKKNAVKPKQLPLVSNDVTTKGIAMNGTIASTASSINNSDLDQQSYQLWLLDSTRNDLIRYLNYYRQGCYDFYHNNNTRPVPNTTTSSSTISTTSTTMTQKKTTKINKSMIDITDPNNSNSNGSVCMIGNILFPPLNSELCQQPYLILPYSLSAKQRKIIHECCLQLDIYHDSVNDSDDVNDNQRVMILSCYADGFQYLPQHFKEQIVSLESTTTTTGKVLDLHLYKPWYCRRSSGSSNSSTGSNVILSDNYNESHHDINDDPAAAVVTATAGTPTKSNRSSAASTPIGYSTQGRLSIDKQLYTQQMKEKVWALIDQPSNCIRDAIDTISYEQLHQKSLANYNYQNVKTTPWTLVDTPYKMQLCIHDLQHPDITEIAFDIESYNVNSSTQITCLIQITSNMKKEYIIDPLAPGVWDEIQQLQSVFGNPNIVKIGHAIASLDVPSLYRDFGIVIVNVFDTYEAAKCVPQIAPYGLAGLCQYYYMPHSELYQSLKDTYQTCNWRVRPLTPDMMLYGRMDVHYLISLRQLLIRDMILAHNPLLWKTLMTKVAKVKSSSSSDRDNAITDFGDETGAVVETNNDVLVDNEVVDELVIVDTEKSDDPITAIDKNIVNGHIHDDGDHTATSIGDDPFLSEVHYNKLIPSSSNPGPILTKNRDVFDFLAQISYEEDNYGSNYVATPTVTSATYDENVIDDDDQTNASYNTAFQSLHPKSSTNGSFNESVNYSSDALYNTCTEEEDEDDVLAEEENDNEEVYTEPKDITPEELRLQPIVMQCIGICQERCLNLWNDKKQEENYLNNQSYQSILRKKSSSVSSLSSPKLVNTNDIKKKKNKKVKAQPKNIDIMPPTTSVTTIFDKEKDSFTKLYVALVDWRRNVADEVLECLPGFVVSLDFLVNVAYKRPMTMAGLQLIAQQLPIALQQNEVILNSLLDVVIQQTMVFQQLSIPTATIYYYSNLKLDGTMNDKENGRTTNMEVSNALTDTLIVKVLIGGSLSIGFLASLYDVVKENPQQFNIMPYVELLQRRIPLYMNHFIEHQLPVVMNSLSPYIPSYFKK